MERFTRKRRAAAAVQEVVDDSRVASLIEANDRFTQALIPGQNSLLATLCVQPAESGRPASDDEIKTRLAQAVADRI